MQTINDIEQLTLIEGKFTPEESKEILLNIFSAKVKFHEMKNFSSQLRFGTDNEAALNRITDLKECIERIRKIVAEAEVNNKKVHITSTINIELTDY